MGAQWTKQYREDVLKQIKNCAVRIAHDFVEQDRDGRFGRPTGLRHDAGETAALALQLEQMLTTTFFIDTAPPLAFNFIPVDDSVTPAETISYEEVTRVGAAKRLSHYGQDIPLVDVFSAKVTHRVAAAAVAFHIDVQSLRAAAMAGIPIENRKSTTAQLALSQWLDTVAATGSTEDNILGLVNHTSLPACTATTGTWAGATGAQMFADVAKAVGQVHTTTLQNHTASLVLVAPAQYAYLDTQIANTSMTAKQSIRENLNVRLEPWHKLSLADAGGTGPRIIVLDASPGVIQHRLTQPIEFFPAQLKGLTYETTVHCRTAGNLFFKPLAGVYMDGC